MPVQVVTVAGSFARAINHIFPHHKQLIYLLTSHQRRHAWHIWLAHKPESVWQEYDRTQPHPLTEYFLTARPADLITDACGELPKHIFPVLGRLPHNAGRPEHYVDLCRMLLDQPMLASSLVTDCQQLPFELIGILAALPPNLRHVSIASKFRRREAVTHFLACLEVLGMDADNLPNAAITDLLNGQKVGDVVRSLYYRTPFPTPVIADSDRVKYLATADMMAAAGRRYRNCLASQIGDAIANRRQFYEWLDPAEEHAIFALRNDQPFGFLLCEMAHASNFDVNSRVAADIISYLADYGVTQRPSVWDMVEGVESDTVRWRLRAAR